MSDTENPSEISTAADFFATMGAVSGERVKLPSGLTVILARPSFLGSLVVADQAKTLAKAMAEAETTAPSIAAARAYVEWITCLFAWAFVSPRFIQEPAPGEIGIVNLLKDDVTFMVRWLAGVSVEQPVGTQESASTAVN